VAIKTVVGSLVVAGAAFGMLYAILGRVRGSHRPWKWLGGGETTLAGELSICVFFGSIGAGLVSGSAAWVILALPAWVVGYVSQGRANRRHRTAVDELRRANALRHPGVFDGPPPDDVEAVRDEELDVYDTGTYSYIGSVPRSDVKALIIAFADILDQGPNDIFVIVECLDQMTESGVSRGTVDLLRDAFEGRDHLVLRWMPPARNAP
jgi:hypothetical protein